MSFEDKPEQGHLPAATQRLKFEVLSGRIACSESYKFVTYSVRISKECPEGDNHPCIIERRYTDFLQLFTQLKLLFPKVFSNFAFPKKAIMGNFSAETISSRSTSFQCLLFLVVRHEKARESLPVITFLVGHEETQISKLIEEQDFKKAVGPVEGGFQVLNKVLTDRHPAVLRWLCLLVACGAPARHPRTSHFALTALKRFESVSDTDSLRYYVPLLQLCIEILPDPQPLKDRLSCMKRRGVRVDGCPTLLQALTSHAN